MKDHRDLTNPNSLRSRIRKKRVKHLIELIRKIITTHNLSTIKICDLGGTYRYWFVFPFDEFKDTHFEITLVNINKRKLTEQLTVPNATIHSIEGDGCDMHATADKAYHLSHSNSVIEHVGNWRNIKQFKEEMLRIGLYHFIQTPNYWFPVEPHYFLPFIQFLPRPIHTELLMWTKNYDFDLSTRCFEENRMLTKKEFRYLFPRSRLIIERFFLLPKSYIAVSEV